MPYTEIYTGADTSCTFAGAEDADRYEFFVYARNSSGDSPHSESYIWTAPQLPDIAFNVREGWYAPIVLARINGDIVDETEYYANEELVCRFDVRNLGAEYQGNVALKMYYDDQIKVTTSVLFDSQRQGYYSAYPAVSTPGTHTIRFVLDEEGLLEEANKENNVYAFTVTVLGTIMLSIRATATEIGPIQIRL